MVTRWSQTRSKALHLWLLVQSPRDALRWLHLCCAGRFQVPTWVSYQSSASLRLFSTKVSYWHLISSRTRFRSTGGAASTSTLSRSPSWQRSEFTSCDTDEGLVLGGGLTRTHLSLPVLFLRLPPPACSSLPLPCSPTPCSPIPHTYLFPVLPILRHSSAHLSLLSSDPLCSPFPHRHLVLHEYLLLPPPTLIWSTC